ncbi:MAG TPA: GGDEF domain-containing protein, partial [Chloroflexota bacterium]|nr:GGDEF domain-containing protein [Chloroflexota bacterium]
MKQRTPAAQLYVDLIALAAVVVTLLAQLALGDARSDWAAFGFLTFCAAIAHNFPINPAFNNVTYQLTNTFVLAGAMLLSPLQAALLPALALLPDLWRRRRKPGIVSDWLFNAGQTALASLATTAWVGWTGTSQLDTVRDFLALMAAVALFTLVQAALVGLIISLSTGRSLAQAGTFAPAALLGDGLIGAFGILVGGLWLAKPVLLLSMPPLLLVVHRLTRTAHLAALAETDPKTGLHNSRHFERALLEELAHSQRVHRPLALLFADLDHFKQVNDRHGHDAGDLVLRELARLLQGLLRKGDLVARFGGEEFVALLPGTGAPEASYLAERLRAAVE